ncbi:MAG: hypothetical protein R6U27_04355, partial [Desulfobacterales bacterium]
MTPKTSGQIAVEILATNSFELHSDRLHALPRDAKYGRNKKMHRGTAGEDSSRTVPTNYPGALLSL